MQTNSEFKVLYNHSLKKLNSWRVGGVARKYYKPASLQDMLAFMQHNSEDEFFILGLGSNVLISDEGVHATVIHTLGGVSNLTKTDNGLIRAEAGVACAKLAKFCIKNDLADGAFWAGIPGTVGGALAMNAGAFGAETWDYVVEVELFDNKGHLTRVKAENFNPSYRQVNLAENQYFAAAYFKLPLNKNVIAIEKLLKKRAVLQPIGKLSCGSVFKNPEGGFAAKFIDEAGLKGVKVGQAQVSLKHSNFIINLGGATSNDISSLIEAVKKEVYDKFSVNLFTEVKFVG